MYAVVYWHNYRKELNAGFVKKFDTFEEADKYAYSLVEEDAKEEKVKIITEEEITDNNGAEMGPYENYKLKSYGASNDGYNTTFYNVVPYFIGVENDWDDSEDQEFWEEKYGDLWYPEYS